MVFNILADGRIWIQFVLVEGSAEERFTYSEVLNKYGSYNYTKCDIIDFVSDCPTSIPNLREARAFVEKINDELGITSIINA